MRIQILLEKEGLIYRFGRVNLSDANDIYFNYGPQQAYSDNLHDSYHTSNEVHTLKRRGDKGITTQFIPPEKITAPVQFATTTGRYEDFNRYTHKLSYKDILFQNSPHVTHPVIGVYIEPARTLMVRRAYNAMPPPNAEVLSIQTRRLTPILDLTAVHVSVKETIGGLINFPQGLTSKDLKAYYKSADSWILAMPPDFNISVEIHKGLLQDLPRSTDKSI